MAGAVSEIVEVFLREDGFRQTHQGDRQHHDGNAEGGQAVEVNGGGVLGLTFSLLLGFWRYCGPLKEIYCIGYWLEKGLIFASNSRTNAGVDCFLSYSKMYVFQPAGGRLFVLLTAGKLATTQAVVNHIQRDLDQEIGSQASANEDLRSCHYLFEAAAYVGAVSVAVHEKHCAALKQAGTSAEASFILGGGRSATNLMACSWCIHRGMR